MATSNFTEFNLPRNAYTAFDAVSMKQLIVNRIRESKLFPDVDFEGSNISGLVDIVAYTYHVLLFYLNQTATEAMFSQAELYENMNKLVSLLGYKPQGYHTPILGITCTATSNLPVGMHAIKRFTYTYINNIPYTFNSDVIFEKTESGDQIIESVGSNFSLYQGIMREYPIYTAIGEDYEQFTISVANPDDNAVSKYIDNNNIFVFVRDVNTGVWSEWSEISSLYIASNKVSVFEKRFNEDGRYEVKFGNGVTGRKLNAGDQVAVYYLYSDGDLGVVSPGKLQGKPLTQLNTARWSSIFNDTKTDNVSYLTPDDLQYIQLDNPQASTQFAPPETVDEIRNNAPLLFSAQSRTVTREDYDSVVRKYFSHIITDVSVVPNSEYTSEYLKYFYDIGLERPNDDEQVLMNQITFTDACDFNNVYLFVVPKNGAIIDNTTPVSLPTAQKQAIATKLNGMKLVNQNIVVCDPVYSAFSFGLNIAGEELTTTIKDETKLRLYRSTNFNISKESIAQKAVDIITNFFAQTSNKLGSIVNIAQLNNELLSIGGVAKIETVRYNTAGAVVSSVPKINMVYWNPLYPQTTPNTTSQNIQLEFFKFPFFYDVGNVGTKIEVV